MNKLIEICIGVPYAIICVIGFLGISLIGSLIIGPFIVIKELLKK